MGHFFSSLLRITKSTLYPILHPINSYHLIIDTISYIPRAITSNSSVQLALEDFDAFSSSFFHSLKFWLLPALIASSIYFIKNPSPAQINEALDYYKTNQINTVRHYEYKYPLGVFAEYLKYR
jgi:hypothetical protein